jgi:predicted amidophosphoribosyltransferase
MTPSPPSRETLRCGSWFIYATRGTSDLARSVRNLVLGVKRDAVDPQSKRLYSDLIAELLASQRPPPLVALLEGAVALVPVPGSGLRQAHSVWPARSLCQALHSQGFGAAVWPIIERATAVRKSAWSATRPSANEHAASFTVKPPLNREVERVVLVDDVVTRGCTLLGAAKRLRDVLPTMPIEAFALARVQSTGDLTVPREAKIEWLWMYGADCSRGDSPPGW